jgi:hypothetical protein
MKHSGLKLATFWHVGLLTALTRLGITVGRHVTIRSTFCEQQHRIFHPSDIRQSVEIQAEA